jgi:hypothetical protein
MYMDARRGLAGLLLILLCVSITIGMQTWIGDVTIYSESLQAKRALLHESILSNTPPDGESWASVGARGTNLRVGTVFLTELVRKSAGVSVYNAYRLLDSIFLFLVLVGLYFYLRLWAPDAYCVIGVLYFATCVPLTYFLYYFHPWDKPQLLLWLILLYLTRERRFLPLLACLMLSIVVKFDTILLPGLYLIVHFTREDWKRVVLETACLAAAASAVYLGLGWLFPAPGDPSRFTFASALSAIHSNLWKLAAMNVKYPPLLVHTIPLILATTWVWKRERFVWCSVLFAVGMLGMWFLFSNFEEVRAEMAAPILLLPAAVMTLRDLLERGAIANRRDYLGDPPH